MTMAAFLKRVLSFFLTFTLVSFYGVPVYAVPVSADFEQSFLTPVTEPQEEPSPAPMPEPSGSPFPSPDALNDLMDSDNDALTPAPEASSEPESVAPLSTAVVTADTSTTSVLDYGNIIYHTAHYPDMDQWYSLVFEPVVVPGIIGISENIPEIIDTVGEILDVPTSSTGVEFPQPEPSGMPAVEEIPAEIETEQETIPEFVIPDFIHEEIVNENVPVTPEEIEEEQKPEPVVAEGDSFIIDDTPIESEPVSNMGGTEVTIGDPGIAETKPEYDIQAEDVNKPIEDVTPVVEEQKPEPVPAAEPAVEDSENAASDEFDQLVSFFANNPAALAKLFYIGSLSNGQMLGIYNTYGASAIASYLQNNFPEAYALFQYYLSLLFMPQYMPMPDPGITDSGISGSGGSSGSPAGTAPDTGTSGGVEFPPLGGNYGAGLGSTGNFGGAPDLPVYGGFDDGGFDNGGQAAGGLAGGNSEGSQAGQNPGSQTNGQFANETNNGDSQTRKAAPLAYSISGLYATYLPELPIYTQFPAFVRPMEEGYETPAPKYEYVELYATPEIKTTSVAASATAVAVDFRVAGIGREDVVKVYLSDSIGLVELPSDASLSCRDSQEGDYQCTFASGSLNPDTTYNLRVEVLRPTYPGFRLVADYSYPSPIVTSTLKAKPVLTDRGYKTASTSGELRFFVNNFDSSNPGTVTVNASLNGVNIPAVTAKCTAVGGSQGTIGECTAYFLVGSLVPSMNDTRVYDYTAAYSNNNATSAFSSRFLTKTPKIFIDPYAFKNTSTSATLKVTISNPPYPLLNDQTYLDLKINGQTIRLTCSQCDDTPIDYRLPVTFDAVTITGLEPPYYDPVNPPSIYPDYHPSIYQASLELYHYRREINQHEKVQNLNFTVATRQVVPLFEGFPVIQPTSAQFKIRIQEYPGPSTIKLLVQPGNIQGTYSCRPAAGGEGMCDVDVQGLTPDTEYAFRFGVIYNGREVNYIAPVIYRTPRFSGFNLTALNTTQTSAALSFRIDNVTSGGPLTLTLSNGQTAAGNCDYRSGSAFCSVNVQGLEAGTDYTVTNYNFQPSNGSPVFLSGLNGLKFTTKPAKVEALQAGYVNKTLQITAVLSGYQPQFGETIYFEDPNTGKRIPAVAQCNASNGSATCQFTISITDLLSNPQDVSTVLSRLTLKIVNRSGGQISVPYTFFLPKPSFLFRDKR